MTDSEIICHRLIDLIIRRGTQQVSDHCLLKNCLNLEVLNQKKSITNQLIKHTGLKSEFSKLHNYIVQDPPPPKMKKQQMMYRSLGTVHRMKLKIKLPLTKSIINSFSRRKSEKNQPQSNFKQTKNTFKASSEEESKKKKIYQLQPPNTHQLSQTHLLRTKLLEQDRRNKQQQQKKNKQDQLIYQSSSELKKKFEKQLSANKNTNAHTYNTNGRYIIYSQNNQKKAIQKSYPIALNPQITQQQIIIKKKQSIQNKSLKKLQLKNKKTSYENQHPLDLKQSQLIQDIFNNNNQRQTSSIEFLKLKQGTCFGQPSLGKFITQRNKLSSTYSSFKQKSTFSKFFQTKQHLHTQIEKTAPISITKREQTISNQLQLSKTSLFSAIHHKSKHFNGKIKSMNDSLLQKLIFNV